MAEVSERDPVVIRRRILEEFEKVQAQIATNPDIWRILSFKAHKELCKVLGEDFVDYPEFEFWFARFARGDFELDYDRRSDPKARSFTDLPLEIFEKVIECLWIYERMRLRDVCKDIRYQFDNLNPKITEFHSLGCCPLRALKLPKLQLEKLTIWEEDKHWKELIEELDESNRKLHVKKVEFTRYYPSSKIDLHFMIPGVLEEIKLFLKNPNRKDITKIIESEQCQAAKMVYIESDTIFPKFPRNVFYNCPRFTLRLGIYRGGGGPADKLKAQFLKRLMKKAEVQKCVIYFTKNCDPRSQILKCFDEPEAMVPNFPSLRRYPIPGTNEFYEIEHQEKDGYQEEFVCLERKQ
ncbi:hypothetical protein CRE_11449 [Caenorhabditis remanei]|uniref:F-box domain-containing protein n=1 Tax=Caenorhabditis remanei TaxID=31234 RepID=E3NBD6_CAERE|nr:hypothetical protein CRE_11449 [Caenorhabditis remanei]